MIKNSLFLEVEKKTETRQVAHRQSRPRWITLSKPFGSSFTQSWDFQEKMQIFKLPIFIQSVNFLKKAGAIATKFGQKVRKAILQKQFWTTGVH